MKIGIGEQRRSQGRGATRVALGVGVTVLVPIVLAAGLLALVGMLLVSVTRPLRMPTADARSAGVARESAEPQRLAPLAAFERKAADVRLSRAA